MIPENSNIYLETSAINYFVDNFPIESAEATYGHHILKGTRFYISNVSIWEILLTNNVERREEIVQHIQRLGFQKLIKSPSEFIINFIENGCPAEENKFDIHSNIDLAETWSHIWKDKRLTFLYSQDELKKRSNLIRNLFKYASKEIQDIIIISPNKKAPSALQEYIFSKAKKLKRIDYHELTERQKTIMRLSLLLILLVLCNEITLDNAPIQKFWKKIGVDNTILRFEYVLENLEILVTRGPFPLLAEMAYTQIKGGGKPTRGVFWDILHSLYLVYTDFLLSNDEHFLKLKNDSLHLNFKKIIHLEEIKFFYVNK